MLLGLALGSCSLKTLQAAESPPSFNQVEQRLSEKELKSLLNTVDTLYDANKMVEGLAVLEKYSDSGEAEILWRLARFVYKVNQHLLSVYSCMRRLWRYNQGGDNK